MDLHILIDSKQAAEVIDQADYCFIDCRFNLANPDEGMQQYQQSHIPGAIYAHLDRDLSGPLSNHTGRHPLPHIESLSKTLSNWGITNQTSVIIYDQSNGMFASRLWWLLRWLGHSKVAVLDGGFAEWQKQGRAVATDIPTVEASTFVPQPQTGWICSADEIPALQQQDNLLLDARAAERYRGEVEPIDPIAGHIPGALNYPLTDNLDENGLFKTADTIRQQFVRIINNHHSEQVYHYCGSGVSACHNILAMEYAGLHGSKLYPGSWSEWIRDVARPIATGNE
ncbi:MAG: sulfurtransferase [Gammaproteobacteria bacterium]|nr:sulfurtransferase [Gammaproteobacteria bacterium]